jgi:general transcription factor IIIA
MEEEEGNQSSVKRQPIFRDIRRYYCEYCGICRSKRTLITSHIISDHQDEMKEEGCDEDVENEGSKLHKCEQCDITFKKPAHLKQHMQSHSFEGEKLFRMIDIM